MNSQPLQANAPPCNSEEDQQLISTDEVIAEPARRERQSGDENNNNLEAGLPAMRADSSSMLLRTSAEDSWADCFSAESDKLDLHVLDEIFGWGTVDTSVELKGMFEEETMLIRTESGEETQQSAMTMPDLPSVSRPPEISAIDNAGLDTSVVMEENLFEEKMLIPTKSGEEAQQSTTVMPDLPLASPEINAIDNAGLPVFTPEDQMAEVASLTTPEIQSAHSDLYGITASFANLRMDNSTTSRPPRSTLLSLLDHELSKLSVERKEAYCQALLKCPGLVSDERKMAFLEREDGDSALAAVRLALYWELRLKVFGPDKCFLPMTLEGAMKGEVENMVRWPIHRLLPVKDTAGRAIWYFDPSQRDFDNYSINQELMALWYILEVNSEDPEALTNGLVHISTWKHVEMKHMGPKEGRRIKPPAGNLRLIVDQAFPIRFRAAHFCQPRTVLYYLFPILKSMFGKRVRQRLKLHSGSEAEILQSLEEFCLPKDRVPTEFGGEVVPNMAQFLAERTVLESSRPDPRLVSDDEPIFIPTGPATKRSRSDQNEAVEATALIGSSRGKPDPRMTLAVDIRLANFDLPLQDVLLKAGYKFDLKNEKGEAVDADNITLKQRRNNLCRRVRQERARLEDQGAGPTESQQGNGNIVPNTAFSAIGTNAWLRSSRGKPDPRMTLAVDIRLENPKMPLQDVLLKAGYTFDLEDQDGEPIGPDKISLSQRKNNLCRRVRQEKEKREAQQQDNAGESDNSMSILPSATAV